MTLRQVIKNMNPQELLLVFDFLKKRNKDLVTPSPLTNKEEIEKLLRTLETRLISYEELENAIYKTVNQSIFPNKNSEYKKKIDSFADYIKEKWNNPNSSENDKTKSRLAKAILEFFLICHNLDKESLSIAFPLTEEEFLCFNGSSERIEERTIGALPKNDLLQILADEDFAIKASLHSKVNKIVGTGNEVHANSFLHKVLDGAYNEEDQFIQAYEVPNSLLLYALNSYPLSLYIKFKEKILLSNKDKIAIAKKIGLDEFLKFAENNDSPLQEEGLLLNEDKAEAFYKILPEIEAKIKESLSNSFKNPIFEDVAFIEFDSTEKFDYHIKLDFEKFEEVNDLQKNKESHLLENLNEALGELNLNTKKTTEISLQELIDELNKHDEQLKKAYKNKEDLLKKLKSKNISRNLQGLNILFALSRSGPASCIFNVFDKDVFEAAKNIKAKEGFLFQRNKFKLDFYLAKAQETYNYLENWPTDQELAFIINADENFQLPEGNKAQINLILEGKINEVDPQKLHESQFLFILNNLSTQDFVIFLEKIDQDRLDKLTLSDTFKPEFGKGISNFTENDILKSLLLRPDFNETCLPFLQKISNVQQNENLQKQKILFLTKTLLLAKSIMLEEDKIDEINKEIEKMQGEKDFHTFFSLEEKENILRDYFAIKNLNPTEKTAEDDKILNLIPNLKDPAAIVIIMNYYLSRGENIIIFTKLLEALKANRTNEQVKYELEKITLEEQGLSSLHIAAEKGCAEILEKLFDAGISPTLANRQIYDPLSYSVSSKKNNAAKLILENIKENIKKQNPNRDQEFYNQKLLDYLTSQRYSDGNSLLSKAIESENPEIVKILLDVGMGDDNSKYRIYGELGELGEYREISTFIFAISRGQIDAIKMILENIKVNIKKQNQNLDEESCNKKLLDYLLRQRYSDGTSLLFEAINSGNPEIVKILLDAGMNNENSKYTGLIYPDDNITTGEFSPFIFAISREQADIVKILLENIKVNIKKQNPDLDEESCNKKLLDYLLKERTPDNGNALFEAIESKNPEIVKILLDAGMNNKNSKVDRVTPFLYAITKGYAHIANFLLEEDPNVINDESLNNNNAIHEADNFQKIEIVRILLIAKMRKPNSEESKTSLFLNAVRSKCKNTVKLEIAKNPNVINHKFPNGNNALFEAILNKDFYTTKILLDAGMNNDNSKVNGYSPLILAINSIDCNKIVELILENIKKNIRKENPNNNQKFYNEKLLDYLLKASDKTSPNPLYAASCAGNLEIARILLEKGMNNHNSKSEKSTPFLAAVFNGEVDIVKMFLERDPSVIQDRLSENHKPFGNSDAFEIAKKMKRDDVLEILKQYKIEEPENNPENPAGQTFYDNINNICTIL